MSSTIPVIFLAFANDRQDQARYLRGLAEELRGIRQALNPGRRAKTLEVVERANATLADIIDVFQDPEYAGRIAVFHYGGHADSYQLLLDSGADQGPAVAHADGFNAFLAQQQGLQFVFLNGCSTGDQAMGLRMAGIPAVVATSQVINDAIAQRFAIRFYSGLGAYQNLQKAFQDSAAEILTFSGPGNTRSLYWGGEEQVPDAYPWQLLPDPPPLWSLKGSQTTQDEVPFEDLKIGQYAHVLCDRYPQNDEFVSTYLAESLGMPQVFLIHGTREEKHESLITRFSYEHIGPRGNYLRPVEITNWPIRGDRQTLLKVRLAEHFEEMNGLGKAIDKIGGEDLLKLTRHSGQEAIILQHNIPAEYWDAETASLVKWYIGTFWQVNPLPEAPRFVIFINVFYADKVEKKKKGLAKFFSNKNEPRKIQKELIQIAEAYSHCEMLTVLDQVKPNHVEDWLIETNLAEVDDCQDLTSRIFSGEAGLPMGMVEPGLKEAVKLIRDRAAQKLF